MADDPRIAPMVSRWGDAAKALLPPEWSPEWFIVELLAAADPADPLRALLADESRATRLIATTWVGAFGAAWEDCSPEARDMTLIRAGHVLAALQKVADRA